MNEVLLVEDEPELGASIAEYLLISGIPAAMSAPPNPP